MIDCKTFATSEDIELVAGSRNSTEKGGVMLCDVRLKSNSTVMLFRGIFGLESKEWFKLTAANCASRQNQLGNVYSGEYEA